MELGDYIFIINDRDGICCLYGNGFYIFIDGIGVVIVLGGSFDFSESISFCISSIVFKFVFVFRVAY